MREANEWRRQAAKGKGREQKKNTLSKNRLFFFRFECEQLEKANKREIYLYLRWEMK